MTLTREQEAFKQWADETFGPAPAGGHPQHERYASYFTAFNAGRARGLGEAKEEAAKAFPKLADGIRGMILRDMRKRAADLAEDAGHASRLLQHSSESVTRKHYRTKGAKLKAVR